MTIYFFSFPPPLIIHFHSFSTRMHYSPLTRPYLFSMFEPGKIIIIFRPLRLRSSTMPRTQNYSDLSKGRMRSSLKEPGIRLCTHTCPVLPTHVLPFHIFSNAGSSGPRHNNDTAQHPQCNPTCPAHHSHPNPRVNDPPTFAEWMELPEDVRRWSKVRYGASTPPNDLSDGPSAVPPVPSAAAGNLVPSAPTGSVVGGSLAPGGSDNGPGPVPPPNNRIGDFESWAWPDVDEDSKNWFISDPNMFPASEMLVDLDAVMPMVSTPNSPAPGSPKKKVRLVFCFCLFICPSFVKFRLSACRFPPCEKGPGKFSVFRCLISVLHLPLPC